MLPILFKIFIDDGFGVTKGSKKDFEYWVSEFNMLRETITIDKFKYGDEVDFMFFFIFLDKSLNRKEFLIYLSSKNQKINICTFLLKADMRNIRLKTFFLEN